jgi:hypothetical protein
MRARHLSFLIVPIAVLGALVLAGSAQAKTPIYSFDVTLTTAKAGAHPDLIFDYRLGNQFSEPPIPCGDCNGAKEITTNTPPGLLAAPRDLPRCTLAEFSLAACPVDSQIGMSCQNLSTGPGCYVMPLFSMVPKEGQAALIAFPAPIPSTLSLPIFISFTVRTESDYGLEAKVFGIPRTFGGFNLSPSRAVLIFWGVPSDPVHDPLRKPLENYDVNNSFPKALFFPYFLCNNFDPVPKLLANEFPYPDCGGVFRAPPPVSSNAAATPFISNPTTCSGPLTASGETLAYDGETDSIVTPFPAITGCDQLTFAPSLSAQPTTTEADSPSGLDVELVVPQTLSATTPSPSQIRGATLKLPPGFTINASAADGKVSCSAAQANFGSRAAAQCPEYSKIGNLEIETSSLPGALPGALYLGEPLPGDRYRVFLVADGFSLHIKLAGTVKPDLANGMTLSFPSLPQTPFQRFSMHVFGAERGTLATPIRCGTYPVESTFVPWAAELPIQSSTQFFTIESGPGGTPCPGSERPFEPEFTALSSGNTAGANSSFVVDLKRREGDQFLSGLEVSAPLGFAARLKGIPYCPESAVARAQDSTYSGLSELAAPACPEESQVGTGIGGAGAGSYQLHQAGKAYLAGPYKGAPLSLLVVIPAVTGPYDLGNLTVRVAVYVDPVTARVTTVSDPLPLQIDGIPLRVRTVRVDIDRSNFALNPTNCSALSTDARVLGDEGGAVQRSAHYQVANCAALPYGPKLRMAFSGGVKRRGHPAIHAVFTAKPGEANSRRISVLLPKGQLLDNSHIRTICTRVRFASDSCPPGSKVGTVVAHSPILDQPLRGSIYLRSSLHDLPDLALDLEGQFDIEAAGRVDSVKARLRTTFETVPDVPVSRIDFDLIGGGKGLLQNTEDLCARPRAARLRMTGQNGARVARSVRVDVPCGRGGGKRNAQHGRGGR